MELSLALYLVIFFVELLLGARLHTLCKEEYDTGIGIYKKNNRLVFNFRIFFYMFLIIFIPAIFAGMRYGIGSDYDLYKLSYEKYSRMPYFLFQRYGGISLEIGYFYLTKIAQLVFNNYQGILFLAALLSYGLAVVTMKRYGKYGNLGIMLLIYFVLYYAPSYNIVRQIIATSIIFYGFKYIEQKKIIKYVVTVIVATTFHTSALFCLPLYFLNFSSEKFSKTRQVIIMILAFLLPLGFNLIFEYLSEIPIFSKYASIYTGQLSYSSNIMTIVLRLPILIPIIITSKKIIKKDNNNRFLILLYLLEFTAILMGFYMHWAFRIMYYCMFAEILLVPQIIKMFKGKSKLIISVYFIAYYIYYFYRVHYLWGNDAIFPYKMF